MNYIVPIITTAFNLLILIFLYFKIEDNDRQLKQISLSLGVRLSELLISVKAQAHAELLLQTKDPKVAEALEIINVARLAALQTLEEAKILADEKLNPLLQDIARNTAETAENTKPNGNNKTPGIA